MKRRSARSVIAVSAGVSLSLALAQGQVPAVLQHETSGAIPFSTLQHVSSSDSADVAVEKAAKVLPRPNQTAWMRLERTFFIHFGPNTFRGVEWGNGHEDPSVFNPTQLDADQWIRAVRDGGGKEVILVCKHHDGLALWPTRYTGHSIAASPWRGGKGNLVREVSDAAHKYGIKFGVYLSPADLYQLRTNTSNPHGYYGDGSAKVSTVIPTDPASFKTNPSQGRPASPGFGKFTYDVDDYNRYFLNQLYELLTEYGRIDEVWFDGANPDPSVHEEYDYAAWYDMIRHLQPQAIIFGKGPDGRWVGNEEGMGRKTEWSVIPLPSNPDMFRWPDMTDYDLGSRSKLVPGSWLWWYPAETDVPILHGWFWGEHKASRTAAELVDIYYQSVGRNDNLLLNISPDRRGLIPDLQIAHLRMMNEILDGTFAHNLAAGAKLTVDNSSPAHEASSVLDGNLDTWWEAAPGQTTASLTLQLPHAATFDVVSLQEAVDHRGQRIESFAVDVWSDGQWKQMDQQTTVGHKRLLRWDRPVTSDRVRIRITGSRLEPTLAEVGLFKQVEFVPAPSISERDSKGSVTIAGANGLPVVYTTDGTLPTANSPKYHSPIPLLEGGTVQAAVLSRDGKLGMIAASYDSGLAPLGWKVVSPDAQTEQNPASNAIDGDPKTVWRTKENTALGGTHEITVDMGATHNIAGLGYLPPLDHKGIIEDYRFDISMDGSKWKTVSSGSFANVRNNPELQEVHFAPVEARFFRFVAVKELGNDGVAAAAEISVLPATAKND